MKTRTTIDHRDDRVPIDEQCAEMIGIVAETEFDLQRRVGNGQISRPEATERRRRRHAILATLKWLQENREAVIHAHKILTGKFDETHDLDAVNHDEPLTEYDS